MGVEGFTSCLASCRIARYTSRRHASLVKGSGLGVVFVVTGSDDLPRIAVAVGTTGGMQLQGLHSGQSVDGCFQLPASKNFKLQCKIAPNSSELVELSMVLLAEQAI